MNAPATVQPVPAAVRPPLWREWPLWCVVVLVLLTYFLRLDDLTVRGEESRRATVGMEMIATGDWIVPRQQGLTNFMSSRPPLQNWMIALTALARGDCDAVAVRLPSVVAILLMTVFMYAYARTTLSSIGAMATATAYATFGQIMELGRLGETDAVFTLFLGSAMLCWHWGHTQNWPAWKTWTVAYTLLALATLTKGPQAPVYFAASVGLYLLLIRQWRYALSWEHLAGIGLYAALFSVWFVPFASMVGWEGVKHTFSGDAKLYVSEWSPAVVLHHYITFPLSIVLGSLLPWSLVLALYADRSLRERLGAAAPAVLFAAGAILITIPSVWLLPGTRSRFFVSLYPCFAVLVGVVIDRCAPAAPGTTLHHRWRAYMLAAAGAMAAAAVGMPLLKLVSRHTFFAGQSWPFLGAFSLLCATLAVVGWWSRAARNDLQRSGAILSIGAFAALMFAGAYTNFLAVRSQRYDLAMEQFEAHLPDDARLVSLGPIEHTFAYYHRQPIPLVTRNEGEQALDGAEYICFSGLAPPFYIGRSYQVLAEICFDRERVTPERMVVVARLLPAGEVTAQSNSKVQK